MLQSQINQRKNEMSNLKYVIPMPLFKAMFSLSLDLDGTEAQFSLELNRCLMSAENHPRHMMVTFTEDALEQYVIIMQILCDEGTDLEDWKVIAGSLNGEDVNALPASAHSMLEYEKEFLEMAALIPHLLEWNDNDEEEEWTDADRNLEPFPGKWFDGEKENV